MYDVLKTCSYVAVHVLTGHAAPFLLVTVPHTLTFALG